MSDEKKHSAWLFHKRNNLVCEVDSEYAQADFKAGYDAGYDAGYAAALATLDFASKVIADGYQTPVNTSLDWAREYRGLPATERARLDSEWARIRADLQRRMGVDFSELGWRVVRTDWDSLHLYTNNYVYDSPEPASLQDAVDVGNLRPGEFYCGEWRYEIL
jgi:hypothetical protein